ncbi:MAG: hypothetical protein SFU91_12235 [Chloroherpetonaceae bacterium]|nr:hypothetical protein [Chloroherpetonaceae bacterium]
MKSVTKFFAILLLAVVISGNYGFTNSTKPAGAWSDWVQLKDGRQDLIYFRYQQVTDQSMVVEIRNDYKKAASGFVEIATMWNWCGYQIDYVKEFNLQPGTSNTESIRGSKILGVRALKISLKEPKVVL